MRDALRSDRGDGRTSLLLNEHGDLVVAHPDARPLILAHVVFLSSRSRMLRLFGRSRGRTALVTSAVGSDPTAGIGTSAQLVADHGDKGQHLSRVAPQVMGHGQATVDGGDLAIRWCLV